MSANTAFRRSSAALGAAGILALSLAGPASARQDPSTGELPRCTTACYQGPDSSSGPPSLNPHGNGLELIQLGGGLLAGVALAGAGMALASRRGHAQAAHPA